MKGRIEDYRDPRLTDQLLRDIRDVAGRMTPPHLIGGCGAGLGRGPGCGAGSPGLGGAGTGFGRGLGLCGPGLSGGNGGLMPPPSGGDWALSKITSTPAPIILISA